VPILVNIKDTAIKLPFDPLENDGVLFFADSDGVHKRTMHPARFRRSSISYAAAGLVHAKKGYLYALLSLEAKSFR
jgi:hypothetical protein